jgi:hypothetical protein
MANQDKLSDKLERQARRAIFWHALMRWESATIIALTMIISAFLGLLAVVSSFPVGWALVAFGIGFVIEAIIFISSLTDQEENARVVAQLLRTQYEPKRLRSANLRNQLERALEYQGLIASSIRRTQEGVLRDRLLRATEPVDDWIEAIYRLAARLDVYEQNQVIRQDLRAVPVAIDNFKKRLTREDDRAVQETLRNTIADKERQLAQLTNLQNTMERAEYQLESTLAALGTVYAQLQTIDLKGSDKGRTERLREEIGEQVTQLQDLDQAMEEVYSAR